MPAKHLEDGTQFLHQHGANIRIICVYNTVRISHCHPTTSWNCCPGWAVKILAFFAFIVELTRAGEEADSSNKKISIPAKVAMRPFVSRCLAQKYAQTIHTACHLHKRALARLSGTEAVVRAGRKVRSYWAHTFCLFALNLKGCGV